jgi:hypothetical protein
LSQQLKQVPSKPPSDISLSNPFPSDSLEINTVCALPMEPSINREDLNFFSQSLEVAQPHSPLLADKDKEKKECERENGLDVISYGGRWGGLGYT